MRKKLIIHSSLFSPFLQITIPIPFPIPNNPNQVPTLNDLIAVNTSALLIYEAYKNITFNTLLQDELVHRKNDHLY